MLYSVAMPKQIPTIPYPFVETKTKEFDLIIPVYEKTGTLKRTQWSILQTIDLPCNLVIAEGQQSVAKNRIDGLTKSQNNAVVMMDDDVLLPPFWPSKMLRVLEDNKDIGVVSCSMTYPDLSPQNDLAYIPPDKLVDCTPPGTCFAFFRDRIEGCQFDPEYETSQWEDTDFMIQVQRKGLQTMAYGAVWVLHDHGKKGFFRDKEWKESWERNRLKFVDKWPEEARKFGLTKVKLYT